MLFSGGGGDTIPSVSTPGELKSCTHRTLVRCVQLFSSPGLGFNKTPGLGFNKTY